MAKKPWRPPASGAINSGELIGRRIFSRAPLRGAEGQPSTGGRFEYQDFEDKELSVDRMGPSGNVDDLVCGYLRPRCLQAQGSTRQFRGWATLKVKDLLQERKRVRNHIVASPVPEDPAKGALSANIYHAHIPLATKDGAALETHFHALHLQWIFEQWGGFYPEPSEPAGEIVAPTRNRILGFLAAQWAWLIGLFGIS